MRAIARWSASGLCWLCLVSSTGSALRAEQAKGEKSDDTPRPATVIFRLYENAILTIDGDRTFQTGAVRKFVTPPLQPGLRYYYEAVAVWEPNNYTRITRTRKVYVFPGKETEVDFRKEDPSQPDKVFVRYVPTPQAVVDAMLKLGKAEKGDVVYDLGCGDGRIPITAVARFGVQRGVGIDLDPQRILESKRNAKEAGVQDRVEFRQGDVLKLKDLGDASLVTLYLGEDLNKLLRPLLLKSLKPGSRIVSHRFLMGDWKPDKTEELVVNGVNFKIHLWTIKEENKKEGN